MHQGDILLTSYHFDPLSCIIRMGTKSQWSHISWILNKKEAISAHGTGVRIEKIKKFKNKFLYTVKVIRLKHLSSKQIRIVSRKLCKQQNHYNYFKFVLNLFHLLFTHKRKYNIPTCAFLIASELMRVGYYIKKNNLKYIVPEDFNRSKRSRDITNEF
jgi:hypothetical protein